jgi:hypothetical protein
MQFIRAALASIWQGFLKLTATVVDIPFAFFRGALGIGGGAHSVPDQPPAFEIPVDTRELVDELHAGHQRHEAVRDLDRDGVTTVVRFAKASEEKRATFDLSAVKREDVRDLLLTMKPSELQELVRAGSGPIRKLLVSGDAGVWGVPSVKAEDVTPPADTKLALQMEHLRAALAKKGSKPYTMPRLRV